MDPAWIEGRVNADHLEGIPSRNEQAYVALRGAILNLSLAPGEEISEVRLAGGFGFGRSSVRAALTRLAHDRLVEVIPRRGYIVAPVTLKHTSDVFGLRLILEPAAARLAADRATDAQIERLRTLNAACARPLNQDDLPPKRDANKVFHLELADASGNGRLKETISGLLDELERVLYLPQLAHVWDRVVATPDEHGAIIDAIAIRDGERAAIATARHIEPNMASVIRALIDTPEVALVNLSGTGR